MTGGRGGVLRAALVLLALAACSAPRPAQSAPGSAPRGWEGGRAVTSNDGAWRIVYRLEKDPIPRGETFSIDAWVFAPDAPEAPRTDVLLAVDAAMPEHGHGMNRVPRIEALAGGRFRAEGLLFHMSGKWELYFDVTQEAVTERAQTDVLLE